MSFPSTIVAENGDKLRPFWATIVAVFGDFVAIRLCRSCCATLPRINFDVDVCFMQITVARLSFSVHGHILVSALMKNVTVLSTAMTPRMKQSAVCYEFTIDAIRYDDEDLTCVGKLTENCMPV